MSKTIIAEGKTTKEATEKGLRELNVSRNQVELKVLDSDDKRSFFSILAPRVVKVELTLKENVNTEVSVKKEEKKLEKRPEKRIKREYNISEKDIETAYNSIEKFLKEFVLSLSTEVKYELTKGEKNIFVNIQGGDLGFLIGYRGETLYSLQTLLSSIASKNIENRVSVILNIGDYKEKREKTLEDLAEKVAKTVIKTGKQVKLEPMQAYERKVIHSKLQENDKIETFSIGEEPHRRIVVSLKK